MDEAARKLHEERAMVHRVLKRVEWAPDDSSSAQNGLEHHPELTPDAMSYCGWCRRRKLAGHTGDCQLKALLDATYADYYEDTRGCHHHGNGWGAPISVPSGVMYPIEPIVIDGEVRERWRLWDPIDGVIYTADSKRPVLISNELVEGKPMDLPQTLLLDLDYSYGKKSEEG